MKTKLFMLSLAIIIGTFMFAQDGERRGGGGFGGPRKTVAERVAAIHAKFDSTFHFAADKQAKCDSAFSTFYTAQDAARDEMRANMTPGQAPDPSIAETLREKNKELVATRDEKLQEILTEEEYKKWKTELEPSLRPQRGSGMGNGKGNNADKPKEATTAPATPETPATPAAPSENSDGKKKRKSKNKKVETTTSGTK
jgi:periplasmic protein CpxP/Spy